MGPEHPFTKHLRDVNRQPGADYERFRKGIEHPDPGIAANVLIGLIQVTNYLLDRQIDHPERKFVEEGGLSEGMTRARIRRRRQPKDKTGWKK